MGKGGTGVIKRFIALVKRSRDLFVTFYRAKRFRHSPIFPLRSNFQFEYYSTCCSDIRCDQFLLGKREEGRKGERRVVH